MTKMIMLKNSDEQTFDIEETAATGSKTIKHMIEDDCANLAIPLPNITSKIIFKVTEYLKKHDNSVTSEISDEDKKVEKEAFDTEFVKVDHNTLFDLTLAANYLDIKGLLDLTCKTIADMIKGKTPEEIRQTFKEAAVRKENAWAFE